MKTILVEKDENNSAFNELCKNVFLKNKKIFIAKDKNASNKIVDELRKENHSINGNLINQREYCYALMRSLYDCYISDIDEFAFLYLKVCIACDYNTIVTTYNILDEPIIYFPQFNVLIENYKLPEHAYSYITFDISREYFHRDRLIMYELFANSGENKIPPFGANIPLSDYRYLSNGYYRIRLSSITLIKIYFEAYYWLPKFRYRFGISTMDNIAKGLEDIDNLGRDVNIWCPDENVGNYSKIHSFEATTSMGMLHDLIHLSILSSYPKHLALLVFENVKRMRNINSKNTKWNMNSLSWKLIDFSVSHEGKNFNSDLTMVFSIYIKCTCKSWFEKLNKQSSKEDREKLSLTFFNELLLLINKNKLWKIDGRLLMQYLGFDMSILESL